VHVRGGDAKIAAAAVAPKYAALSKEEADDLDTAPKTKPGHTAHVIDLPDTALDALAAMRGLFVKQKVDWAEAVLSWEQRNRYELFGWEPTPEDSTFEEANRAIASETPFATTVEDKGDCCHRQCCKSNRRWTMRTKLCLPPGVPRTEGMATELKFTRPFKCTCFCLERPVVFIWWGEHVIAEIRNPFDLCEWIFIVGPPVHFEDRSQVHPDMVSRLDDPAWYTVSSHMCAKPLVCQMCVHQIPFRIRRETRAGEEVGLISRVWAGCAKECFTKVSNFGITFPGDALPMQKAALLATALLIDFLIFESQRDQQKAAAASG
jgi:hypothetical protein